MSSNYNLNNSISNIQILNNNENIFEKLNEEKTVKIDDTTNDFAKAKKIKLIKNDYKSQYFKINKKNFKNFLKNKIVQKFINHIILIIYNLIAFYLYYLSLEGCEGTNSECIPKLATWFLGRILIFGATSALLISVELFIMLNKKIYLTHLIYIISFFYYIYEYDHGSKLDYHGLYNFAINMVLIAIFSIIIGIIYLIIILKRKNNKIYWTIFILVVGYIAIRIFIFSFSLQNSCRDWDMGLNGTRIDNNQDKYSCNLIYPKRCFIYNLNNFFDIPFYLHKTCYVDAKQGYEHKNFIDYLKIDKELASKSSMTHLGLPVTVNNPKFNMSKVEDYLNVHNLVYKNIILMDLYNGPEKEKYYNNTLPPEIEIIFDKKTKKREAKIHLIKNETLSKIRNEIANDPNNKNDTLFNNVILIYVDCVSRQHFLRKMPKTAGFIEKFMKYNNDLGFSAYQFFKYQTFAHYTMPNIIPLFFGRKTNDDRRVNIVKYFKDNGFVTGNSGNICSREPCSFEMEDYRHYKITLDEYDHENIAMFCDPNYSSEDSPYPIFSGPYGILRKCLFGLDTFKYLLEYGKQFWNAYKDNRKYLRLMFQDGHEPTGQVVKYIDDYLYAFLNELYEKKLLNDTAMFFFSDHGNSYFNYVYYYIFKSDDSIIEQTHGTLFIILPSNKNKTKKIDESYYNNIYENQQTLISPYDIHDTVIHIVFGNNTMYNEKAYSGTGYSLLAKFDGKTRNCKTFENMMRNKEECICLQKQK